MSLAINNTQATPRLHAIAYLPYPRDSSKVYWNYAMVAKGLDQITRGRPMRGLALKEKERWNQFYAPHAMVPKLSIAGFSFIFNFTPP